MKYSMCAIFVKFVWDCEKLESGPASGLPDFVSPALNIDLLLFKDAQTLAVAAEGTLAIEGGTLKVGSLDLSNGGAFSFDAGTLEVAVVQGNLNVDGGKLAASYPRQGPTSVSGDYVQTAGILEINLGGPAAGDFSTGDLDQSGYFDGGDILLWQRNANSVAFGSAVANADTARAIPEPSSLMLAWGYAWLWLGLPRTRRPV